MELRFEWTDGNDPAFAYLYPITEQYYNEIIGGIQNRLGFIPHNLSASIHDVLICYDGDSPIACAGLRKYSETDIEVKRVWVMPDYRGNHLGTELMNRLHERAAELGYQRTILQTRELMVPAVKLYEQMGYTRIPNYPPYDQLDNAICMVRPLS